MEKIKKRIEELSGKKIRRLGFFPDIPILVVTDCGLIYSTRADKVLIATKTDYSKICHVLCNGSRKLLLVHRVVAITFMPNPENKKTVNHIDGDKHNNHVDNLEWATVRENSQHAGHKQVGTIGPNARAILNTHTGVSYISSREAEKTLGYPKNTLADRIKRNGGKYRGEVWVWIEPPISKKMEMDDVEHRVIPNYPNHLISIEGKIYSQKSKFYLKQFICKQGYASIKLSHKGKYRTNRVHTWMALTYFDTYTGGGCINHKDGDKLNNKLSNLEEVTLSENSLHSARVLGKNVVRVFCVETGKTYANSWEASQDIGCHPNTILDSIRKGYKIKGYTYARIDEDELVT